MRRAPVRRHARGGKVAVPAVKTPKYVERAHCWTCGRQVSHVQSHCESIWLTGTTAVFKMGMLCARPCELVLVYVFTQHLDDNSYSVWEVVSDRPQDLRVDLVCLPCPITLWAALAATRAPFST